ncbi:DUF7155 family protein [Mycolicibacterium palauense]|uniref:DUF7155 family protein n=1 Tax=Mycolicibacterium palauense TaxID=2034511 RepID=UPI000BFEB7E5|nr:hypothetical protein [Mycolicibacterium palauense]
MARTGRLIAGFAVAAAAVAAPLYGALSTPGAAPAQAQGPCLAWLGSMNDGQCIAWSMAGGAESTLNGVGIGVNGPTTGNPGVSTSPLLPGRSISIPLNP